MQIKEDSDIKPFHLAIEVNPMKFSGLVNDKVWPWADIEKEVF